RWRAAVSSERNTTNGSLIVLLQIRSQCGQTARDALADHLLGTAQIRGHGRVWLVEHDPPGDDLTLLARQRRERGREIDRAALRDQLELLVVELRRRHPEPDAARSLDLASPAPVNEQGASDPDQPAARRPPR